MLVNFIMTIKKFINPARIFMKTKEGKGTTLEKYLIKNNKNVISALFENFLPDNSLKAVTGLTIGSQAGDRLTLINSGVKIGKNVSKVLISGWGFNNQNESNLGLVCGIIKNGSIVDKTTNWQQSHSSNDNITMNISPTLVDVEENDVVNIALEINKTNNTYKFSRGGITVEVID